jgi:hypothetical protein
MTQLGPSLQTRSCSHVGVKMHCARKLRCDPTNVGRDIVILKRMQVNFNTIKKYKEFLNGSRGKEPHFCNELHFFVATTGSARRALRATSLDSESGSPPRAAGPQGRAGGGGVPARLSWHQAGQGPVTSNHSSSRRRATA